MSAIASRHCASWTSGRDEQCEGITGRSLNVTKIIIQARPKRDAIYVDYLNRAVSNTKMYGDLYKAEDCIRLLVDCGVDDLQVTSQQEMWPDGKSFPMIFASKREPSVQNESSYTGTSLQDLL